MMNNGTITAKDYKAYTDKLFKELLELDPGPSYELIWKDGDTVRFSCPSDSDYRGFESNSGEISTIIYCLIRGIKRGMDIVQDKVDLQIQDIREIMREISDE